MVSDIITYDDPTVPYNGADIQYDGTHADIDRWAHGQDFDIGTDVTTSTGSGSWSFIGSRAASGTFTNPQTITHPVGTASGDLIFAFWMAHTDDDSVNTPSGWTRLPTAQVLSVTGGGTTKELVYFYKIVASDTDTSWDFDAVDQHHVIEVTFRNSGLSASADLSALQAWRGSTHALNDTASGGTLSIGAYANAIVNNLGLYAIGVANGTPSGNSWTPPSNVTLARANASDANGTEMRVYYEQDSDGFPASDFAVTWGAGNQLELAGRAVVGVAVGGSEVDTWSVIP